MDSFVQLDGYETCNKVPSCSRNPSIGEGGSDVGFPRSKNRRKEPASSTCVICASTGEVESIRKQVKVNTNTNRNDIILISSLRAKAQTLYSSPTLTVMLTSLYDVVKTKSLPNPLTY